VCLARAEPESKRHEELLAEARRVSTRRARQADHLRARLSRDGQKALYAGEKYRSLTDGKVVAQLNDEIAIAGLGAAIDATNAALAGSALSNRPAIREFTTLAKKTMLEVHDGTPEPAKRPTLTTTPRPQPVDDKKVDEKSPTELSWIAAQDVSTRDSFDGVAAESITASTRDEDAHAAAVERASAQVPNVDLKEESLKAKVLVSILEGENNAVKHVGSTNKGATLKVKGVMGAQKFVGGGSKRAPKTDGAKTPTPTFVEEGARLKTLLRGRMYSRSDGDDGEEGDDKPKGFKELNEQATYPGEPPLGVDGTEGNYALYAGNQLPVSPNAPMNSQEVWQNNPYWEYFGKIWGNAPMADANFQLWMKGFFKGFSLPRRPQRGQTTQGLPAWLHYYSSKYDPTMDPPYTTLFSLFDKGDGQEQRKHPEDAVDGEDATLFEDCSELFHPDVEGGKIDRPCMIRSAERYMTHDLAEGENAEVIAWNGLEKKKWDTKKNMADKVADNDAFQQQDWDKGGAFVKLGRFWAKADEGNRPANMPPPPPDPPEVGGGAIFCDEGDDCGDDDKKTDVED
jgi:hypothetical protein